jgi:SAM-dependent methyltransferase
MTSKPTLYGNEFFAEFGDSSYRSAAKIVPEVLQYVTVSSVVDFGCGVGTWLRAFADNGVTDLVGVDGQYIDREQLRIPPEWFIEMDLAHPAVVRDEPFDLAVSLETAEHLPPATSASLIDTLVRSADHVLFGAAIPGQGGLGHVNERWQPYWAELFASHGYGAIDIVRPKFWNDPDVVCWYPQNTFLYVKGAPPYDGDMPMLAAHPSMATRLAMQEAAGRPRGLREVVSMIPSAFRQSLRARRRH